MTWRAPAVAAFLSLLISFSSSPTFAGAIQESPANPRWLFHSDGSPLFFCGPGDPENFFYRGSLQSNGTRNGDQNALIQKLTGTGANCIYVIAVRSHGGDGDPTQNPFLNHDPNDGLNSAVLDQWDGWLEDLSTAGVVTLFFFYDDDASIWNTGSVVGAEERQFFEAIVNRFEHHDNLIWCIAEEYSEALSIARVSALAEIIEEADDFSHPVSVHERSGYQFDFPNDEFLDSFAMQIGTSVSPSEVHEWILDAWDFSAGRYNVNLSELLDPYTTRAETRRLNWAAAMGGAYVMVFGMDIASTPVEALEDCGHLASFFESTRFDLMVPHDPLKRAETDYVLGNFAAGWILYGADAATSLGIAMPPNWGGTFNLRWMDCASGAEVTQNGVSIPSGDRTFAVPSSFGNEVVLELERATANPVPAPEQLRSSSFGAIKSLYR
jgi:hypothetical protein